MGEGRGGDANTVPIRDGMHLSNPADLSPVQWPPSALSSLRSVLEFEGMKVSRLVFTKRYRQLAGLALPLENTWAASR